MSPPYTVSGIATRSRSSTWSLTFPRFLAVGRLRCARSLVGVSALPSWHPAHPDRCHLQDGPAISPAALALISCNATISTMIHDLSGAITDVGRRTRKPPPALRRALRERDRGRCQYPGCASRRTDAHHAAITPTTINPPHSGEHLNLSLAIWIAFANARTQADRVAT